VLTTIAGRVLGLGACRLIASDLNVTITITRATGAIQPFRELRRRGAVAWRKYRKRSMGSLKPRACRSITEKLLEKPRRWPAIKKALGPSKDPEISCST
jgi:hypothetical protein